MCETECVRVIPYACELDTAAQPQPVRQVGAQSSLSRRKRVALVPSLERQVNGDGKIVRVQGKQFENPKNSLGLDQSKPLFIYTYMYAYTHTCNKSTCKYTKFPHTHTHTGSVLCFPHNHTRCLSPRPYIRPLLPALKQTHTHMHISELHGSTRALA